MSYSIKVVQSLAEIKAATWNALLEPDSGPFLRYEFLATLEETGCVGNETGWQPAHLILRATGHTEICGAMPLYLKRHSYGEYVFDWAWAEAYNQNGLQYYPKALCAIPFTPVQGGRILAHSADMRTALVHGLKQLVKQNQLSSAHVLFPLEESLSALVADGFLLRNAVQFHWHNQSFIDFEGFLNSLNMKKRKNIRRERRIVEQAGITFKHLAGSAATQEDWQFFYRCYANTYFEHHSTPYLNQDFFMQWAERMPENLHLIFAKRDEQAIAASLLVIDRKAPISTAYGRYWGCLEHLPCLHFETAYYQAIEFCIAEKIQLFEGGAQGQHKMARGFLPTTLQSAHWLADERFLNAVDRFLEREREGIAEYIDELQEHSPLRQNRNVNIS